ncbi:hypothetical protein GCM10017687_27750 [Streptomyces echinatus]
MPDDAFGLAARRGQIRADEGREFKSVAAVGLVPVSLIRAGVAGVDVCPSLTSRSAPSAPALASWVGEVSRVAATRTAW